MGLRFGTLGPQKNKILGVNAKINYLGGKRTSPVDQESSRKAQDVIYDYSRLYMDREDDIIFLSAAVEYRINKYTYRCCIFLCFGTVRFPNRVYLF